MSIRLRIIQKMICGIMLSAAVNTPAESLLKNSGLESSSGEYNRQHLPECWQFYLFRDNADMDKGIIPLELEEIFWAALDDKVFHNGGRSLRYDHGERSFVMASGDVQYAGENKYCGSCRIKNPGGNGSIRLALVCLDAGKKELKRIWSDKTGKATEWQEVKAVLEAGQAPATAKFIRVEAVYFAGQDAGEGSVWFDDVMLTAEHEQKDLITGGGFDEESDLGLWPLIKGKAKLSRDETVRRTGKGAMLIELETQPVTVGYNKPIAIKKNMRYTLLMSLTSDNQLANVDLYLRLFDKDRKEMDPVRLYYRHAGNKNDITIHQVDNRGWFNIAHAMDWGFDIPPEAASAKLETTLSLSRKVWLDDIKIAAQPIAVKEPEPGRNRNLLEGGNFEAGIDNFQAQHWRFFKEAKPSYKPAVFDTKERALGNAGMRFDTGEGNYYFLGFHTIKLEPENWYTFSFYAKSSVEREFYGFITSSFRTEFDWPLIRTGGKIGPQWKKYTRTFYLLQKSGLAYDNRYAVVFRPSDPRNYLFGNSSEKGDVWIDGVAVREGISGDWKGYEPIEIAVNSTNKFRLLMLDSKEQAQIALYNDHGPENFRLDAEITDSCFGNKTGLIKMPISLPRGQSIVKAIDLPSHRRGHYKVSVKAIDPNETELAWEEFFYGVLPDLRGTQCRLDSFFGNHINPFSMHGLSGDVPITLGIYDYDFDDLADLAERIGVKWLRCFQIFSTGFAKKEGGVETTYTDYVLKLAAKHHMLLMPCLADSPVLLPLWMRSKIPIARPIRGGTRANMPDLKLYDRYVRDMVGHFKGRIPAWEIWNEPHAWFPLEQYLEVYRLTAKAIKETDPDAKVVGLQYEDLPAGSGSWLDDKHLEMRRAVSEFSDVSAAHCGLSPVDIYLPEKIKTDGADIPEYVRETQDGTLRPREYWCTESGAAMGSIFIKRQPVAESQNGVTSRRYMLPGERPPRTGKQHADDMAMAQVFNMGKKMKKFFVFQLTGAGEDIRGNPIDPNFVDSDFTVRPGAIAYATCAEFLEGKRPAGEIVFSGDGSVCFLFEDDEETVAAALNYGRARKGGYLAFGKEIKALPAYNVMGQPISFEGQGDEYKMRIDDSVKYFRCKGMKAGEVSEMFKNAKYVPEK